MNEKKSRENDFIEKLRSYRMKPLPDSHSDKFKKYCKKCKKTVITVRDKRTKSKTVANVFSYLINFGPAYTYEEERCPHCGKVLARSKPPKYLED